MFYFFDPKQNTENAHHYRGLLFEKLLRRFLEHMGYSVEIGRRKHRSLEYDLSGTHGVDKRPVIGEAKAHEASIGGQDLAAFVGKCLPFYFEQNQLSGLFLSTSALSPDAEDYLRGLKEKTPLSITKLCGDELEQQVRRALQLPTADFARAVVATGLPFVSAEHILQTDTGVFLVVVGSSDSAGFPDRFAVLRHDGRLVREQTFLDALRSSIQSLQGLDPVGLDGVTAQFAASRLRTIPFGLLTANDWVDYRRPAPPQFFVGRVPELKNVLDAVLQAKEGMIVEIKARSGVGKSSLLSVLAKQWTDQGDTVELHDSRDVHSATDILSLLNRFIQADTPVRRIEETSTALTQMQQRIGGRRALFIVDQFESTFQKPEVFAAYEYIAVSIARLAPGLAMIFARKDDLLTTHDDVSVNLDRLRSLAVPITLDDFSRPEAAELVRRISDANPGRLNSALLAAVLEFAQGFPWLLKRTMAHVLAVLARGVRQKELLSAGLELEDLFEEELRGLDEMERGYLRRLAIQLPATYHYLLQRYENDPLLPKMLETLRERKLLRLSAGTYDTYNDVFKEFLLYNRLPDSSQAYMFRLGPVPVMTAFRSLGGRNTINPEELGQQLGTSLGGVYNLLRELRLVGLNSSP